VVVVVELITLELPVRAGLEAAVRVQLAAQAQQEMQTQAVAVAAAVMCHKLAAQAGQVL
jgi:hypothetical protein